MVRDLPSGCDTARFFLDDSSHELKIAEPATADPVTAARPPLPDVSDPTCALRVSYGAFAESASMHCVAVTSAAGLVAADPRQQPRPGLYGLVPVGLAADVWIFCAALVTMPVWGTLGLVWEHAAEQRQQQARARAEATLPPAVVACWTAADNAMKSGGPANLERRFDGFDWAPAIHAAYALSTLNGSFSDAQPVAVDQQVTLGGGRIRFKPGSWTDAEFDCGLSGGEIVATGVRLRH